LKERGRVPDWRCVEDYAFTEGLSRELWAWEFLRRNPEYRRDWQAFWATWQELEADYGSPPNRDFQRWKKDLRAYAPDDACIEEDELGVGCAGEEGKVLIECWMGAKWGFYKFPLDPARDRPKVPEELLWREVEPGPIVVNADDLACLGDHPARMALGFDLSLPLKPQLDEARQHLLAAQRGLRRAGNLPLRVPEGKDWWTRCLRLLDAEAAGARETEIAAILGQGNDEDAWSRLRQNAHQLVAGGYRRILLLPGG
jgi:hypothetical protein